MQSVSEYIREYINHLEINQILSFNSLRLYKRDLLDFEGFCLDHCSENFDITRLNEEILNKFSNNILNSGRAIATVNRKLTAIHGLWNWLREKGLVTRDPFTQIQRESQFRNKTTTYLTEDQIVMLLDCEEHDLKTKMILELIYATGIRVGELTQLTIEDISLENQIITIPRSTRSKERTIPFNQLLATFIDKHVQINQLEPESKLLLNRRSEAVSEREVFRLIREAAKRAGIKTRVSPSILRNSFIKHMKDNGAHDTLLRDITGQKNVLI